MPKKGRRLYNNTVYISAGHPTEPIQCIDIDSYATKYFVSKYQILNLLRKRRLKAVTYKHKIFIEDVPPD